MLMCVKHSFINHYAYFNIISLQETDILKQELDNCQKELDSKCHAVSILSKEVIPRDRYRSTQLNVHSPCSISRINILVFYLGFDLFYFMICDHETGITLESMNTCFLFGSLYCLTTSI